MASDGTRVYRYGLRHCVEGADVVEAQIDAAHRYQVALTELELARRDRITAIQRAADPAGLSDAVAHAVADLAAICAEPPQGLRGRWSTEQRAQLDAARVRMRAARAAWKAHRASLAADAGIRAQYRAVTSWAQSEQRRLRATCGVYWGSYLLVEAAMEQVRRAAAPPRRPPWRHGAGRVGVQLQRGLPVAVAMAGTDRHLQVAPPSGVGGRRRAARTHVRLRVGTHDREPVWATWECMLHRPLPPDGLITWAVVVRDVIPGRSGPGRYRDELHLTVEAAPEVDRHALAHPTRTVAVDWLTPEWLPDGTLAVAEWADSLGASGTVTVDRRTARAWRERLPGLRSVRDRALTQCVRALTEWQALADVPWPEIWPARVRERLDTLAEWHSPYHLVALYRLWAAHRFAGDEAGYTLLDRWWRGDGQDHGERHRWEYEAAERRTALRRRDDAYRVWAAQVTRTAATVVLRARDLRTDLTMPRGVRESSADQAVRARRVLAAAGRLRTLLEQAAARRGRMVVSYAAAEAGATGLLTAWRERPGEARIVLAARATDPAGSGARARAGGRWGRRRARATENRSPGSLEVC
jgi:hypothetical protein